MIIKLLTRKSIIPLIFFAFVIATIFLLGATGFFKINYVSIVPLVVFGGNFFLIRSFLKVDIKHPFFIISLLFFAQSAMGMLFDPLSLDRYGYTIDYEIWITWVYSVSILVLIYPILFFKKIPKCMTNRSLLFDVFAKFSWPFIFFSFFYLLPFAIASLVTGADTVRTSVIYEEGVLPSSFLTTIAVGVAHFYGFFIILWYYSRICNFGKFYSISMLFGAATGLLWGLVYSARDILIWIPLTFIFGYWLWQDNLEIKDKAKIWMYIKIIPIFFISIFALFTFQRFSGSESGIGGSLIEYFGVQPYVFSEMVTVHRDFYGLSLRFPFIAEIFGTYEPIVRRTPYEWQFGTLLSDFYSVSGWGGYLLIISFFLFFGFLSALISRNNYLYPRASIMMMIYFIIITQGLFYFRLGSSAGNQFIFISLVLAFFWGRAGIGKHAK